MPVNTIFHTYFNSCSVMHNPKASGRDKCIATACIASYFSVVLPILFALGYALTCLSQWTWKVTSHSTPPQQTVALDYPKVSHHKEGLFVEVLNKLGYELNGKIITFPHPQTATKYTPQDTFQASLDSLRATYKDIGTSKFQPQCKDLTTEQAIAQSAGFTIALNFANELHAGGGPGFHWEKGTLGDENILVFIYDRRSTIAQEESLAQRSTLLASLFPLTEVYIAEIRNKKFIRCRYVQTFDSKDMAYVSDNHLFAVQASNTNFYLSRYLEKPKAVSFITSAATSYSGSGVVVDCSKNSDAYNDAKKRIETHLLAAASRAAAAKKEQPAVPVELILGAFGCGAFVPPKNPNDYRQMIVDIYEELLPAFHGFFDQVTFAVPTFGSKDPSNAAVANYTIFKKAVDSFSL